MRMVNPASLTARDRSHLGDGLREMYAGVRELWDISDPIAALLVELAAVMGPSRNERAEQIEPGQDLELAA